MIPLFKVRMEEQVETNVNEVIVSGMVGEGPKVIEFKHQLEKLFKCSNLLPLNSCTSALTLALRLAGVGPGDEVISTPFTMIATNVAIASTGANIVWADIGLSNLNISPADISRKITNKTKAIVVTHIGGLPCNMKELNAFNIPIIADCAHAILSEYDGEHISKAADYSCFSFQAIKHLTCGDGGCLVIKDDDKYELAEKLKWFGMTRKVPKGMTRLQHQMTADVEEWGYKFHMNDISASIGLGNMKGLKEAVKDARYTAKYYHKELDKLLGVQMVYESQMMKSSWWLFPLLVDKRDEFVEYMNNEKEIQATPMWRRNDEYSTFGHSDVQLRAMDEVAKRIVFIPIGTWLSDEDKEYIVESMRIFYE